MIFFKFVTWGRNFNQLQKNIKSKSLTFFFQCCYNKPSGLKQCKIDYLKVTQISRPTQVSELKSWSQLGHTSTWRLQEECFLTFPAFRTWLHSLGHRALSPSLKSTGQTLLTLTFPSPSPFYPRDYISPAQSIQDSLY